MKKIVLFIVFSSFFFIPLFADNQKNSPQQLTQPDGTEINIFASGDEFYNYLHDINGYTIVQNPNTGYYVYAIKNGEHLIPSSYVVGQDDPQTAGLTPYINLSDQKIFQIRSAKIKELNEHLSLHPSKGTNKGNFNNIVIFIRFQGQAEFTSTFSQNAAKFNDSTANFSSMYNYFKAASYNTLYMKASFYPLPNGNTIISYEDSHPRGYYLVYNEIANPTGYVSDADRRARETQLLINAINSVSSSIPASLNIDYDNDGLVDNIIFVVRGASAGWSELLWSHRTSLWSGEAYIHGKRVWDYNFVMENSGLSVSTLCHEMFHTLSAPDLYHNSNDPTVNFLDPVGSWDLMCSNTTVPQHSGAYMKMKYGKWIDYLPEITSAGTYSLKPIGGATNENVCYKISGELPNIFYVLEYRYKGIYFESGVPGSGLTITRINTNFNGNMGYNDISSWDEVYIFRPNGLPYLEYGMPRLTNGNINQAHFSTTAGRPNFNSTTNPYPFFPENSGSGTWMYTTGYLDISNIIEYPGDSIRFTYNTTNYISVSETEIELPNAAQATHPLYVSSNTNWQIGSHGNWYNLNHSSGSGNDTVVITVTGYNTSPDYRYDTIRLTGAGASARYVYLKQPGMQFYVTPQVLYLPPQASSDNFSIFAQGNWIILDPFCPWLSISQMAGSGNSQITVSAQEMTGADRQVELYIFMGGEMISVTIVQTHSYSVNNNENNNVILYPNPVNNILFIISKNNDIKNIAVFNVLGEKLLSKEKISNNEPVDMKNFPTGVYFIKIDLFNNTQTYKIVKK